MAFTLRPDPGRIRAWYQDLETEAPSLSRSVAFSLLIPGTGEPAATIDEATNEAGTHVWVVPHGPDAEPVWIRKQDAERRRLGW